MVVVDERNRAFKFEIIFIDEGDFAAIIKEF
jgi:hypothetical protein